MDSSGVLPGDRALPGEKAPHPRDAWQRVSQERLDLLMNQVGQLVTARNTLPNLLRRLEGGIDPGACLRELRDFQLTLGRIVDEMQGSIVAVRMVELKTVFQRFPRVVRDVARQSDKAIDLQIDGGDIQVDKSVVDALVEPLTHLLRNAADHGIEPLAARRAAGKPDRGTIRLRALHTGPTLVVEVTDDGRGLSTDRLKARAHALGLLAPDGLAALDDDRALDLIFLPGFSTADRVSEISGRGVGLDAVRGAVRALKGDIRIDTRPGQGTTFTLTLPLTMGVARGLTVSAAGDRFIVPMEHLVETVRLEGRKVRPLRHHGYTVLRDEVVPVCSLGVLLGLEAGDAWRQRPSIDLLIVRAGAQKLGLVIDRLYREQDFVVRPLPDYLECIPGLGGSTVLGDGRVVLVLQVDELPALARQTAGESAAPSPAA